jgi:Phage integrase family
MSERYIWKIVRTVAARAGIYSSHGKPPTPHTLRRSFATDLVNAGVRLETVSRLLGRAHTQITESRYAALTDERIREEVETALRASPTEKAPAAKHGEARRAVFVLTMPAKLPAEDRYRPQQGSSTPLAPRLDSGKARYGTLSIPGGPKQKP